MKPTKLKFKKYLIDLIDDRDGVLQKMWDNLIDKNKMKIINIIKNDDESVFHQDYEYWEHDMKEENKRRTK